MDWLGNQLGYKQMDDWYNIRAEKIGENKGWSVLRKYGGSPSKLVMSVYNNHQWEQSNFNTTRKLESM